MKGGTRLQGQPAARVAGLPVISVITVVYNGLSLIEKTIRSIVSQTYPNIEYIVIDGGSTDGTVEILKLYEDRISYWISEPDRGIYDAMNKGLAAATSDYVWFMNAGDLIYSDDTTEKIFGSVRGDGSVGVDGLVGVDGSGISLTQASRAAIYYGDTMIVDPEYREVGLRRLRPPENLTWKSFSRGMLVCHQAIIVSRTIAGEFDPRYRHSADFDWVVRALMKAEVMVPPRLQSGGKAEVIVNTHLILCAFLDGGHSKQNIGISLRERFDSMVRHYGWVPTMIRHVPIAIKFVWYYLRNKRF